LDGFLAGLSKHSFGILLLLLSVIAIAPGASIVAGVLLLIPAFEMVVGRPSPTFPGWVAARPLPAPGCCDLSARGSGPAAMLALNCYPHEPPTQNGRLFYPINLRRNRIKADRGWMGRAAGREISGQSLIIKISISI
jgi:hypothetical protein